MLGIMLDSKYRTTMIPTDHSMLVQMESTPRRYSCLDHWLGTFQVLFIIRAVVRRQHTGQHYIRTLDSACGISHNLPVVLVAHRNGEPAIHVSPLAA